MTEIIADGQFGYTAKVDENNRLHTQSLSIDVAISAALENNAYDVSTAGTIELTDANTSALLYIKNNEDLDIIIDTVFIDSTSSTGGSGTGTMSWVLNPLTGTIIDDANDARILNRRIGSAINLAVDAYKATGNGKTFTNGDSITFPLSAGASLLFGKPFIIPKGQSFGVAYAPPTGNTSMEIQAGILAILDYTQAV